MLPALAGLVAGLAYAAISVYWGAGGRWLLNTVGISLSQPGQAGHLAALLTVWGAAAVKAVAALLPLLAIGVWPRTANGGLRRLARVLAWIEAAILTGYGLILTATGLLVQAGVIKPAAHADRLALKWHACLWDPWFLIWGIFVFLALWRSRPASQDHLPRRATGQCREAAASCRRPARAALAAHTDRGDLRADMCGAVPPELRERNESVPGLRKLRRQVAAGLAGAGTNRCHSCRGPPPWPWPGPAPIRRPAARTTVYDTVSYTS
jgi:Protein of unknown function (DUF3995)